MVYFSSWQEDKKKSWSFWGQQLWAIKDLHNTVVLVNLCVSSIFSFKILLVSSVFENNYFENDFHCSIFNFYEISIFWYGGVEVCFSPPWAVVNSKLMTVYKARWNLCGSCSKLQFTVMRLETVETVMVQFGIHQRLLN